MGVFAEYQPLYARHNIPTFPVEVSPDRKRPAVRGYNRVGLTGSSQLALKFPNVDALAFMAGRQSRLAIVDIDSTDETLLRDTIKRYGETPIMARTSSGGFHLWYRHAGEARKIRPEASVPVDLLGGGVVIAPPSMGARGPYEFIRGSLDDLDNLRPADNVIRGPWVAPEQPASPALPRIGAGNRNAALVDHLRAQAGHCDTLDDLLDVARAFAADRLDCGGSNPFTDDEVIRTAKGVWAWVQERIAEGTFFVGKRRLEQQMSLMALGADAYLLHSLLTLRSGRREALIIANDMRLTMPGGEWTLRRFQAARAALLQAGVIREVRKASKQHGPALYAWV